MSRELVEGNAEKQRSEEAGAKADARIEPDRCSQITRGGNGQRARSEIGKIALHYEAGCLCSRIRGAIRTSNFRFGSRAEEAVGL
jgi:hypothetical protein